MEQNKKQQQEVSSVYCDRFPRLSPKYPWFVVQNIKEDTDDHIFSTLQNPSCIYQCRIPDLLGGRIRGSFHGWLVLSNHPSNNRWSLYNPSTSKLVSLPPLVLKEGDYQYIKECCLTAAPDDPNSVILLTLTDMPTFVYCHISPKRKKTKWSNMSYSNQLKKLTMDGESLHSLTCCNGKIYALSTDNCIENFIIRVDIVVKGKEIVIKLVLFSQCPEFPSDRCSDWIHFLKGHCSELFYIAVAFRDKRKKTIGDVYLFKVDVSSINWEGLKNWDTTGKRLYDLREDGCEDLDATMLFWEAVEELKDAIFLLDLGREKSIFYSSAIASEFGGFIHIRDEMDNVIHLYDVNHQTIVTYHLPSLVLPTSHVSLWECRLQDDCGETKSKVDAKNEEDEIVVRSVTNDESDLLNIPLNALAKIMEFCVGLDYLNFRATCKRCHLAAPPIQWRNKASLDRLKIYSLVSPWLMAFQKHRGVITFKDPMLGDDYYIKTSQISIVNEKIYCSRFGWLLFETINSHLVLFNPFTNDLRELPSLSVDFESLCFSAPPTSPDCKVVGMDSQYDYRVYIHFVDGKYPKWRIINLHEHFNYSRRGRFCFPTLYGEDLYALTKDQELIAFNIMNKDFYESRMICKAEAPKSSCGSDAQYFLVTRDQHVLLVIMGRIGDPIEIFKANKQKKWEKINDIGKHMIYICDTTCLCIEAKMPEMENKIYLPQVCSTNGKIVFYSLDTCTYHTFNGKNLQEDARDISYVAHLSPHAWVEPSWS